MPTNLALVHDSSASPLTPEQLSDRDGEPRIRDTELAERLGFARPWDVRKIIERNAGELRSYGEVQDASSQAPEAISAKVALNQPGLVASAVDGTRGRGRPGKEYWLNEGQALVICALSRTPQAAAVRKQVIEVFLAYRRGVLPVAEEQQQTLAQLASEVAELRQRVALIGAAPHVRAIYRGGAFLPGTVSLTVSDLSMEWQDEPRVFDARLSAQLGLINQDAVRALVRSHRPLFAGLGKIVSVENPDGNKTKGRALVSYWLTELQALAVCGLVSGNVASSTRMRVIKVFGEFRRSHEALAAGGGLIALQKNARAFEQMAERIAALEDTARIRARNDVRRQRRIETDERISEDGDLLYGLPAIGTYLGLASHQVDRLIRVDTLPYLRIGGKVCSRKSLLGAWLDAREVRQ